MPQGNSTQCSVKFSLNGKAIQKRGVIGTETQPATVHRAAKVEHD